MHAELSVHGVAERVEGPLVFLRRTVSVGLNEAVTIIGGDGSRRLGRVATLRPADMTNRKTFEADYNRQDLSVLLTQFQNKRENFISFSVYFFA